MIAKLRLSGVCQQNMLQVLWVDWKYCILVILNIDIDDMCVSVLLFFYTTVVLYLHFVRNKRNNNNNILLLLRNTLPTVEWTCRSQLTGGIIHSLLDVLDHINQCPQQHSRTLWAVSSASLAWSADVEHIVWKGQWCRAAANVRSCTWFNVYYYYNYYYND